MAAIKRAYFVVLLPPEFDETSPAGVPAVFL